MTLIITFRNKSKEKKIIENVTEIICLDGINLKVEIWVDLRWRTAEFYKLSEIETFRIIE